MLVPHVEVEQVIGVARMVLAVVSVVVAVVRALRRLGRERRPRVMLRRGRHAVALLPGRRM